MAPIFVLTLVHMNNSLANVPQANSSRSRPFSGLLPLSMRAEWFRNVA